MDLDKTDFPTNVISIDNDCSNGGSQKRSVKAYASKVFQESTIGIVASIVSTHSRVRRVFKSLVLFLCIVGFSYQCITFLLVVFEYPTTVDVDIERPTSFNVPAYTFCSNNGIKRSVFCDMFPDRCFKPSKKFCSRFYSYCGTNDTLIPKKEYYELESSLTHNQILQLGDDLKDFLHSSENQFDDEPEGPYLRTKESMKGAMICYTLHSVAVGSEYPRKYNKSEFPFMDGPINKFTFYMKEDEMFVPGNRPGVLFSIHSPYEAVNPFEKGIFMKPGRNYKIYVSMTQEVLLKEPFSTKCISYEELWEANNRTGPRIQEMCQHKCLLDLCLECFKCIPPGVLYPHDYDICDDDDMAKVCDDEIIKSFTTCWRVCRDDCKVTKYEADVMERYEVDYDEDEDLENYDRFIKVEIMLEAGEVMTLRHSPKYMTVEVFSAIGGFIGCWLGISLMDILDVLGSVFTVSRYAFRKPLKK